MTDPRTEEKPRVEPTSAEDAVDEMEESPDTDSSDNDEEEDDDDDDIDSDEEESESN